MDRCLESSGRAGAEIQDTTIAVCNLPHDGQPQAMPRRLFVQAQPAGAEGVQRVGRNSGAIVLNGDRKSFPILLQTKFHEPGGPLAGIVPKVAQHLVQVVLFDGPAATLLWRRRWYPR